MSNSVAKELGLVAPRYRRPWTLYVHGLGLWGRYETREEGEREIANVRRESRGMWTTFGPVYEPATEIYDLNFGALRKDAPTPVFKAL
jgi:hypothetical protein